MIDWVVSTFGNASHPFFERVTMLGDPVAIIIVTLGVVGCGVFQNDVLLIVTGLIIPFTVLVSAVLKLGFERARPMTEYAMNMKLRTFSFPSGHACGSTVSFGVLAYIAFMVSPAPLNIALAAVIAAVPVLVGISRVYLGAHFPSDVIAGWVLGLTSLVIVLFVVQPL